ncbi:unnamed protein product [Owenia fusiformis]|uniref:Delta-like protein n=1 Tax=Owenia fusiformis TaxID=6347 RepID=A0A8S4NQ81_OWEFU|nr:unnamed protein product [Owenia fusiformis]
MEQKPYVAYLGLLILAVIHIKPIESTASVSLKLIYFENSNGHGHNGHCCDGRGIFCESGGGRGGCDHYFIMCLDTVDSQQASNGKVCPYGKVRTGKTESSHISFGSRIGGSTANPMTFQNVLTSYPGGILIKADIWDDDSGQVFGGDDDFVDYLTKKVYVPAARSRAEATPKRFRMQRRVKLDIEVSVYCDYNYYGSDCSVYCQAQDDYYGHYTCDPDSGSKICNSGFYGENCDKAVDECASYPCLNGGTCIDNHNEFTCECAIGFRGITCEINIDDCSQSNCTNNSTCQDGVNSYTCICAEGFRGEFCSQVITTLSPTTISVNLTTKPKPTPEVKLLKYNDDKPLRGDMAAVSSPQKDGSWIEGHIHFIIIPIVLIVIIAFLLLFAFWYRRHRSKKTVENDHELDDSVYASIGENTRRNIVKNCTPVFNNETYLQVSTIPDVKETHDMDAENARTLNGVASGTIAIPNRTLQDGAVRPEENIPLVYSEPENEYSVLGNPDEGYMVPKSYKHQEAPALPARNENLYSSPPNNAPIREQMAPLDV